MRTRVLLATLLLVAACGGPSAAPPASLGASKESAPIASASSPERPLPSRPATAPAASAPQSAPPAAAASAAATAKAASCAFREDVGWTATDGEYAGPMFDTHFHLLVVRGLVPTNAGSEGLCGFMDRYGLMAALGFYALPAASPPRSNTLVSESAPLIESARTRVVPMLEMGTDTNDFFNPQGTFAQGKFTDAVLQGYLRPGWVFQGVGEIPANVWQSPGIDSPQVQTVLRNVNAIGGIVMTHVPDNAPPQAVIAQRAKVENDIKAAPKVKFLFHGGKGSFDLIEPLLAKYDNVFFSWDGGPGWMVGSWGSLMHPGATAQNPQGTGGSSAQFVAELERVGIDKVVAENLGWLNQRLAKYPDRITGAMDLNAPWHFEDAATKLIAKTFRKIVAALPASVREKYAYQNALRLFGPYLAR